ncbi:Transcription elongation factor spt5 [Penicillium ucsense]|uniref:Transcription elongation factor SPT5 n=1 Tax=Penicillium ucsense TaxID=2839758 RepID=A0A8J8W5P0_9EURO|nr:Transcription elongation factor spt5 [Penicillium ucsense]KAF7735749.1 Transcription elongation factor spt5 [Penicillium ucsense]
MSNFLNHDYGSEEEDDDFNPAPVDDSDAEDSKPQKRRPSAEAAGNDMKYNRGSAQDDDDAKNDDEEEEEEEEEDNGNEDDEDEDEEEEDDEQAVERPRKRRRGGVHSFFEEEAGVDEEEDEAEDEEDELAEFGTEMHPDDLDALPAGAETDDRRHRQLDRQRELDATMDAEKQAQMLKERYGRNRAAAADALVVPKRLLLPSVNDPSIWGCRCKPGKEREVVYSIQKRMEERPANSRNPIRLISAFERGNIMQGWFYCEARRQSDVTDALEGIAFYYPSQKMTLVPVKEMPDLLRVSKSEELMPGGWVRIKRGPYQGDLAQIEEVETNGLMVTVRLVPRLDYGMNDDNAAVPAADSKRKRTAASKNKPPQRLFSEAEAKKKHSKFLSAASGLGGKSWNYLNETYVDGFLIKDMRVQHLITKDVDPRLEEVTMFARGGEDGVANLDLASLAETLKNSTAEDSYQPGDPVEVYRGEQQGLVGRTVSTRRDIVSLQVTEGELAGQTIDAPVRTLRKRFREGDHVKVIHGSRFLNELGMVVQVKDDTVTILSDMSMQEITVFSKDLRLSAETAQDGQVGIHDVHDLVQLDAATVACVIKVDRESLRVLDQNGSVRDVLPSQIANQIPSRRDAVATDRNGAEIRNGDTVREVLGEQRNGKILHIYRSFLFLHNKAQTENAGISVVRTTNVVTVSARGGRVGGPDLTKMNPALARQNPMGGPGSMQPPQRGGRDRLPGQTVSVRSGRYKGLVGIVRSADSDSAQVELYSINKPVHLPRDILVPKDPVSKRTLDIGGRPASRVPSYSGPGSQGSSAWQGSRTPMAMADSSRTPAWSGAPSRTPAWQGMIGARTPAWKNESGRTPNPAYAEGNRTAYGNLGGRTPAWHSGNRTPRDPSAGHDAFASGSRTPAWNAPGSRTPAWSGGMTHHRDQRDFDDAPTPGGNYSAPTPDGFGAPTPGASAPTPSGWADSAPTPGGAYSAPTPGAMPKRGGYDAPTPAAYDAPTPAMGVPATPGAGYGDDDGGPRYDDGTPSP